MFWATGQGLKVLAGHEELIALRMRAHADRGDLAGVRSEWESYERAVQADTWAAVGTVTQAGRSAPPAAVALAGLVTSAPSQPASGANRNVSFRKRTRAGRTGALREAASGSRPTGRAVAAWVGESATWWSREQVVDDVGR